ncbi:hypothetical protein ACFYNO_17385 [Kitasatospora sp. NPDC006697]
MYSPGTTWTASAVPARFTVDALASLLGRADAPLVPDARTGGERADGARC